MQPEALNQRKIPMTPSGIELATFLLAAQYPNQLHHRRDEVKVHNNIKTTVRVVMKLLYSERTLLIVQELLVTFTSYHVTCLLLA
jgi:hypothetical protein